MYKIYTKNWDIPDGYLYKLWLVMRLTTVILIATLMQVSAASMAQKITMQQNKATLKEIFAQINLQTGYDVVWKSDQLKNTKEITVNFKDVAVSAVLDQILPAQNLDYTITDKTIVIKPKEPSLLDKLSTVISNIVRDLTVKGRVVDQEGKPLPNASIRVKGKSVVTNTNQNGEFEIKGVDEDAVLLVSYIGFKTLEIALKDAVMPLEIKLNVATGELEEVNVTYSTGYQNIPKERATGSFVQLSNEDINRAVSTNIIDRIKNITSSLRDERFGAFSLRGVSTLDANQKPLIVVDGFPYEEGDGKNVVLNLNNLNPNDVESVTILRDAAAASIWGARSANGVIVITTKRGKFNQKTNIQFNSSANIIEKPDLFKVNVMSSKDAIDYERKLFDTGLFNDYDDLYPSFDYFPALSPAVEILLAKRKGTLTNDEAESKLVQLANHDTRSDISKYLLRTAVNQQYNLNVSGGSDKMIYYASMGYDKNKSFNVGNEDSRLTLNLNNTYRPIKNLELNTYIVYTQNNSQNNGVEYSAFLANGNKQAAPYTLLADEDGTPLHVPGPFSLRSAYLDTLKIPGLVDWYYRPIEEIQNSDNISKAFNVRLGGGIKYMIIPDLSLNLNGQYERSLTNVNSYYSQNSYFARNLINTFMYLDGTGQSQYPVPLSGILDYTNETQTAYNLRGLLSYKKDFGIHSISAIAGIDIRESEFDSNSSRKYGYDPLTLSYAGGMDYKTSYAKRPSGNFGSGTVSEPGNLLGQISRFRSYYGNIGYTLLNRYTFTASGRIDASNFFGVKANLKKVPLWSLGGMWDISKETFFKSDVISSLKLRATYGFNGNLDNNATSYATIKYTPGANPYNNSQIFATRFSPPNPGLTWEKVKMINFGADFAFSNNRIHGSLEYYKKETNNLISPNLVDPTSGEISYTGNNGGLKGKGVDLQINGLILNRKLKLTTTLALSYNTDEITEYYNNPSLLHNGNSYVGGIRIIGKPSSTLYSYKWAGLDAVNGNPMGMINGSVVSFNQVLGSTAGVPNTKPEDLVYHGTQRAPFFGNIINTLSYRGFSASFNIVYSFGSYFRRTSVNYNTLQSNWSAHGDYALRWQNPGDELKTNIPSMPAFADSRYSFYGLSEILVDKADVIRLQDIRLSYDLLKTKIRKIPFSNLSLFIYANNLGILWQANDNGLDPILNSNQAPISRSLAFGLTLNY